MKAASWFETWAAPAPYHEERKKAQIAVSANRSRRDRGNAVIAKSRPAQNLHRRKILGWVAIVCFAKLLPFPLA
jgi:hypothetical protein